MTWLLTILGIAIAALGLFDVFQTLLHPTGRGRLSRLVFTAVWALSRRFRHRAGTLTGPVGVVAVIVMWAVLQVLGWALIYLPHVPQGFTYSMGIEEARYGDFAESVYISLVTLATLGYGDVVAIDNWLRLFSPLQAITGFALLTAAVSWFIQIYPALERRRALAIRLAVLQKSGYADHLDDVDPATGGNLLQTLTADLVRVRVDLEQHSETYFFRETESDSSLPAMISYAFVISEKSSQSSRTDIRRGGIVLRQALDTVSSVLQSNFGARGESTQEVMQSFASDHGHEYLAKP